MNKKEFITKIEELGIKLDNEKIEQLDLYMKLLQTENKKYNLTAIIKNEDIYLKHFYDSLTIFKIERISFFSETGGLYCSGEEFHVPPSCRGGSGGCVR